MTREDLILSLAPNVRAISRMVARHIGWTVPLEDIEQSGWIGAINAVDRFDQERGVKLSTFADGRIRGEILDELRRRDALTRDARRRVKEGSDLPPLEIPLSEVKSHGEWVDLAVRPDCHAHDRIAAEQLLKATSLTDRMRKMLRMYYWDEMTMREIGNHFGINESRASQVIARAHEKIYARFLGVPPA